MAEAWLEAAEKITELKIPVQFAKIEAATVAENKALADKEGLEGYPTIKLYKKRTGEIIKYDKRNREVDDFVEFVKEKYDIIETITSPKGNKFTTINNIIELTDETFD